MRNALANTFLFAAGALLFTGCAWAQFGGGGAPPPTRVNQLPLSGVSAQAGAVSAKQSSVEGGAATITSSVQVSGGFSGSVPGKDIPAGPIQLTLANAVQRGLAANLGPIAADNAARAARGVRLERLSALMPNIGVSLSDTVTQVNLAAYGFKFNVPSSVNFSIPTVVGPYNYSSLQGNLSQSIYDPVARRNLRASKESEQASQLNARDARELVVLAVGGSYLQVAATAARLESQRAQVANAEAIHRQAEVRKEAGTNARIDVTRSAVELQTEQQRLSSLDADLRKQKIALARLIGLPQDRELILAEPLAMGDGAVPDVNAALHEALTRRADLKALDAQVRAASAAVSAARAERLPSASIGGNYAVIGPDPTSTHGTFAATGSLNIPVWQGGRVKGDILQAQAALDQRQAELADGRARIEQDVRNALIELETAVGQVRVAGSSRDLARDTLTQSRDRFGAGVATTLEVVQAQQQVATSESDYISSLFSYNLAKLSLARATGEAEATLTQATNGVRP